MECVEVNAHPAGSVSVLLCTCTEYRRILIEDCMYSLYRDTSPVGAPPGSSGSSTDRIGERVRVG